MQNTVSQQVTGDSEPVMNNDNHHGALTEKICAQGANDEAHASKTASLGQLDFDAINAAALEHIDYVLEHFLPDGEYRGKEYVALNPTRDDNELGSFSISIAGPWADFATDERGGDLISLVAYLEGLSQAAAARKLKNFLESIETGPRPGGGQAKAPAKEKEWEPVMPVPGHAPSAQESHFSLGKPSYSWPYKDASGNLMGYVYRFDTDKGKEFRPLTYCRNAANDAQWRWQGFPEPRPLYKLDQLAASPEADVVLCEGEKAADAAQEVFPDKVTTASMNGAKSPGKTDWSPLLGRKVLIWPDNDEAGQSYVEVVIGLLRSRDAKADIRVMEPITVSPSRGENGQPMLVEGFSAPQGWDAADALAEGWTAEHIKLLGEEVFKVVRPNKPPIQRFDIDDGWITLEPMGVFHHKLKNENEIKSWICSALEVTALTRDINNENWGCLVEFDDVDGNHHAYAMPKEKLEGGADLRAILYNLGLDIATSSVKMYLGAYIQAVRPEQRALCVPQIGWHDGVFVLPDVTYGNSDERIILQDDTRNLNQFKTSGTLEDWQEHVAGLCLGNSRLVFSISVALMAPMLYLFDEENGGFHFRSESSKGKTTILRVAASVYGGKDYMQRWRATTNGLEAIAKGFNDVLLCLDELAQVSPEEAGENAYMLGNGVGKQRASRTGGARITAIWRLPFLSAGEISLAQHMASAGKMVRAGQEVRMADIPADAGKGHGAFEELHGLLNGAAFSKHITEMAERYYGTAGRVFIKYLAEIANKEEWSRAIKQSLDRFVADAVPSNADGQIYRVAARFALVAAAGEEGIKAGILPWTVGDAWNAARVCFDAWIMARGGYGSQEEAAILAQVREFFERHGESRFVRVGDRISGIGDNEGRPVANRAGYSRETTDGHKEFLVLPQVFKTDICAGYDPKQVIKVLLDNGLLIQGKDGNTSVERVPGMKSMRFYRFKPEIVGDASNSS